MGKSSEKLVSVTRIGLDLAKNVFQVHGVDAAGNVVVTRKLRRRLVSEFFRQLPPCLVAMEACASAHYWGREIAAAHSASACEAVRAAQQDGCG
jgi:transposase